MLANAFANWLKNGDSIIVTNQDHEANTGPWRRLADRGITVLEWRLNKDTGHLDINDLQKLLDDRVKLVCFPHCSNVVGEINDVSKIVSLIHSSGAFACVDGVSYAPHGLPNVGKIGADIYMFSSYKTYGPHQGIMVVRKALGKHFLIKAIISIQNIYPNDLLLQDQIMHKLLPVPALLTILTLFISTMEVRHQHRQQNVANSSMT